MLNEPALTFNAYHLGGPRTGLTRGLDDTVKDALAQKSGALIHVVPATWSSKPCARCATTGSGRCWSSTTTYWWIRDPGGLRHKSAAAWA